MVPQYLSAFGLFLDAAGVLVVGAELYASTRGTVAYGILRTLTEEIEKWSNEFISSGRPESPEELERILTLYREKKPQVERRISRSIWPFSGEISSLLESMSSGPEAHKTMRTWLPHAMTHLKYAHKFDHSAAALRRWIPHAFFAIVVGFLLQIVGTLMSTS